MVTFSSLVIICVVIGYIIACRWEKSAYIINKVNVMAVAGLIGIFLGLAASFGGGIFVKKEIVVEKYFIYPMKFDEKPIVALMEEHDTMFESDDYIFQTREGGKTKLIKHNLYPRNLFFTCGDSEERYLEIKSSKTCRKNMWIWFFYDTGFIENKAVFKKGDNFLILPKYYSQ